MVARALEVEVVRRFVANPSFRASDYWWFRNPAHQLIYIVSAIIYMVLAPSQVVIAGFLNHQQFHYWRWTFGPIGLCGFLLDVCWILFILLGMFWMKIHALPPTVIASVENGCICNSNSSYLLRHTGIFWLNHGYERKNRTSGSQFFVAPKKTGHFVYVCFYQSILLNGWQKEGA